MKKSQLKQMIREELSQIVEGVYDPGIFKVIFLAGGPGSGKSYVAGKTTGGLGLRLVNSDTEFERLMRAAGLSLRMPPEEEKEKDIVRGRAKQLTKMREKLYVDNRLGVIIDGTGRDYSALKNSREVFKKLGYDSYMIFVNTSKEVALERNEKRARKVPEPVVVDAWNAVQGNMGRFQSLFGGNNFMIVDNNKATEDVFNRVWQKVRGLITKPIKSSIAKAWIKKELQKKKR